MKVKGSQFIKKQKVRIEVVSEGWKGSEEGDEEDEKKF